MLRFTTEHLDYLIIKLSNGSVQDLLTLLSSLKYNAEKYLNAQISAQNTKHKKKKVINITLNFLRRRSYRPILLNQGDHDQE